MRRENDNYPTDTRLTKLILPYVCGKILEPCAGSGGMASVLERDILVESVDTGDIIRDISLTFSETDVASPDAPYWNATPPYDWVVTNPPFTLAHKIIPLAYEAASIGIAFLLRISYLEPTQNRAQWLRDHADNMFGFCIIGGPRPSFTGKGTDSVTVAWVIWRKDWSWAAYGQPCPFEFVTGWKNGQG